MEGKRGQWSSNIGFLMAAVGSAVGLGNIWGFPYKMGENGGFAFLLIYLILAVFVGFVIMLGEFVLGRKSGKGAAGAYMMLSKRFKWVGFLGVLSAFLIMSFYSVLGGYCVKYIVVNIANMFSATTLTPAGIFSGLLTNQPESILYTFIFMALACIIVMGGISGGIERFTKVAMPALFFMLVITIIRSVTLPGAADGLKFMFNPDLTPLRKNFVKVLSAAGGQMFFSLSLGMGAMITYGSYLSKKESLEKNALIVPIADTVVALLAGMAVLPAAFALGGEGAELGGPSLLFVTLQGVFSAMGKIGPYFGVLFYLLVFIAAVTSAISLVEVITTFFVDIAESKKKPYNRKRYTLLICIAIMILAVIVAADGLGSNNLPKPLGFVWLDFMDLWSEGIMMPLGALLMAVFIGYELKMDKFSAEVTLCGNRFATRKFFTVCIKIIAPIAMIFILIGQLQAFKIIDLPFLR